jgi:hypothetical protein
MTAVFGCTGNYQSTEAEFLDITETKVLRVFLLIVHLY